MRKTAQNFKIIISFLLLFISNASFSAYSAPAKLERFRLLNFNDHIKVSFELSRKMPLKYKWDNNDIVFLLKKTLLVDEQILMKCANGFIENITHKVKNNGVEITLHSNSKMSLSKPKAMFNKLTGNYQISFYLDKTKKVSLAKTHLIMPSEDGTSTQHYQTISELYQVLRDIFADNGLEAAIFSEETKPENGLNTIPSLAINFHKEPYIVVRAAYSTPHTETKAPSSKIVHNLKSRFFHKKVREFTAFLKEVLGKYPPLKDVKIGKKAPNSNCTPMVEITLPYNFKSEPFYRLPDMQIEFLNALALAYINFLNNIKSSNETVLNPH